MKKLPLCLLLLLFSSQSMNAQTIKGKLSDSKTKAAIPFASLSLNDIDKPKQIRYITSDTLGHFAFNQIPAGKYLLTITLIGYQKLQKDIILDSSAKIIDLGDVLINEDANILRTVTITGGAPSFSTSNGILKIGVAGNTFFKSSANLLDVFRKLPGLQVNPDGTLLLGSRTSPTLFVDGRALTMNADEIQAYLASLSPDMVESIEMINQPSSKYDGQYQGIIDIKLKRSLTLGLKGTYHLRFQQNTESWLDNSLSLNYKTKKFIHHLSIGHTGGNTYYRYHALQYLTNSNAMLTDTKTITGNQNYNIQAKIGYEPKAGQQLEAFFRTYQISRKGETGNQLTTLNHTLDRTVALQGSDNRSRPKQYNYAGGLNYDAVFKTSELHILTALAQIDNRQNEDIRNGDRLKDNLLSHWKTNSRNNILIRSVQVDYTQNLEIGKLEFGSKYAYTSTSNALRYDTLRLNKFELDQDRSNQFSYDEYITAGYIYYLGNIGKITYSMGLRMEHTKTLANSITTNVVNKRNYLRWLPSANLSYEIQKNEQLSLSYSRRMTRPTFDALNPFRFYYSPRHYWIGNPNLQPSTTNLLSFAYSHKSFNVSLNVGREKDPMVRYPQYDEATNILAFMGNNLPYRDFINIQANLPINLTKWWKVNHNLGLYYNKELRPYFDYVFQIPVYNYIINGSQVFTLKKWLFDMSYNYESKSGNSLYVFAPVFTVDLALQKPWLNHKLNTKLAFQDIFYGGKRRIIFREKTIMDNDFFHDLGTRRIVFSLSYNFGASTYKQRESRKSEEETRAGR